MALNINYTWRFDVLNCYPTSSGHTDVVVETYYYLTASTGSYSVVTGDDQYFPLPGSGSTFIPFEDLTLDIVTGWVTGSLGEEKVNELKTNLALQLEELVKPIIIEKKPSPWLPTPPPVPTNEPTLTSTPTPLP